MDSDLRVLDSARGARVLALDADRAGAHLQIAGLVDPQHRLVVARVVRHVATYIVADGIGIPVGSPQQVLHAVRRGVPGALSDRSAVLAR